MNPYLHRPDFTALADELEQWSAAIERSRREYAAHPFAACGVSTCDRLRRNTGRMCSTHAGPNYRGMK